LETRRAAQGIRYAFFTSFITLFIGCGQAKAQELEQGVAYFMATTGVGMATIWTMDIIRADKIDIQDGYLFAKESGTDTYMLPHWIAEYGTSVLLITGAYGLHEDKSWGRDVSLLALGSLSYTAMNSMGWTLGKKERLPYAIPMVLSFTGSMISIAILL